MNKKEVKLKRRLELVRSTVRELTPKQLTRVGGGTDTWPPCTPNSTQWELETDA